HARPSLLDDLAQHCDIARDDVTQFLRTFSRSGLSSIDAFLGRRDEYSRVGKLAIAWALCRHEDRDVLYRRGNNDHWYSLLWDALAAGAHTPADFSQNRLRVITFNYDRSIELFLHQSARNTYRLTTDAQAKEVASTIGVLHVYGKLGDLSFEGLNGRIYDPTLSGPTLNVAANGILIVP